GGEEMKIRLILLVADLAIIAAAAFLSSRWFGLDFFANWRLYILFFGVKIFFFIRAGLYHAILRYAGLPLAATILRTTILASLVVFFLTYLITGSHISIGFFAMDYLITTFLVGLVRFAPRYFFESWKEVGTKRTLIYGAGHLGEEVARKLLRDPGERRLVGFLDDRPSKISKRVHNLPIYGPISNLSSILARNRVSELIIAISSLDGKIVRKTIRECRQNHVLCRIVPTFSDVFNKEINIKDIDITDLLKREPKDLDEPQIRKFIKGKVILITGAGGSIGFELVRQCIHYGAKKLILVDHSEFSLYTLQEDFSASSIPIRFCLMNVTEKRSLESIVREEAPSTFFHAAAYKHVPIVEESRFEGLYNNVWGTIITAQLAEQYAVDKYVLISTDKAVRPTSVMGASKRISEIYIQNLNSMSRTEFIAVRFGNVLASSGSVVPKFIEQINKGGPVTVTHPEVTRYFMLIQEALQLILQAASIGNGGEIFILNMGAPVRIAEMAEDLIFLSGRSPHKDIKINYTGLRPGEKLYEELLIDDSEKKTQYENITIGQARYLDWDSLNKNLDDLLHAIKRRDHHDLLLRVKLLVPEFSSSSLWESTAGTSESHKVIPFQSVK
ncbi:MAG: polysaccharide biosynthesis protein, partial [Omnitrophica bacterium]|nr:polysaccharide biosynthesis protein [Candidatus Omnitrophota bacterium]